MDELLAAAAEAMEVPEAMIERSARARAKASGKSVEEVLAEWAGVEAPAGDAEADAEPAAEPAADTTAPAEPAPAPQPKAEEPPPEPDEAIGEDAVVRLAAHIRKLPESMIRRSAEARAEASGSTYEDVLADWAGVPVEQVTAEPETPAPAEASAPAAEEAPAADEPATEAPAAPSVDKGALLAAAAEKMGMPESMVERSAGARAKAQDTTVEAVLAEWAGVEAPAAAEEAPAASEPAAATDEPVEPEQAEGPDVEVLGEVDEPEADEVEDDEFAPDEFEPEEEAVAAGALPRWLAALFVFVPAFAIAYALFLPNGPNCGDAGSLAVDPVTGVAVNCDLSEFGEEVADFFAIGLDAYNGIGCVACHGAGGGGVANFPAFTGGELLSTFPEGQCSAQVEWIALGTANWPDPTYGATEKPVGGSGAVMPGFEGTLSPEEIAAVSLYERVAFGGQDLESALVDCGLSDGAETETAAAGE